MSEIQEDPEGWIIVLAGIFFFAAMAMIVAYFMLTKNTMCIEMGTAIYGRPLSWAECLVL